MKDAGITANDLHKILLVGGSTRVPAVQEAVKKITGKIQIRELTQMNVLQLVQLFKEEFFQEM